METQERNLYQGLVYAPLWRNKLASLVASVGELKGVSEVTVS